MKKRRIENTPYVSTSDGKLLISNQVHLHLMQIFK